MQTEDISGIVKLLKPESKKDLRKVAQLITDGKVDAGMDVTAELNKLRKQK